MDLVRGMKTNEEDKDPVREWKPRDEMGLNEGDGGAQGGNKDAGIVRWGPSEAVSVARWVRRHPHRLDESPPFPGNRQPGSKA